MQKWVSLYKEFIFFEELQKFFSNTMSLENGTSENAYPLQWAMLKRVLTV